MANYASCGGRGSRTGGRNGGCSSDGHSGGPPPSGNDRLRCQICGRANHVVPHCWYRYEDGYQKDENPSAAFVAAPSYAVDTNWYSHTGATDHVTNDLDRLALCEKYQGKDQIQTVGGSGMSIHHVGYSIIRTPVHALHLHNILHAPQATKHLLSVHRFTRDNNVFFEFHPYHFLVKDTPTRIPLLRSKCIGGMYPLSFHGAPISSTALLAARPSTDLWHQRLGHPGSFAFHSV
jgi:hypothetical protein